MTVYVDRSRYETYVTDCQFKRWLKYHAYGQGITPISKNIHLEIGISVHESIRVILGSFHRLDSLDIHDIDYAIDLEFEEFDKRVENKRKEFQRKRPRNQNLFAKGCSAFPVQMQVFSPRLRLFCFSCLRQCRCGR